MDMITINLQGPRIISCPCGAEIVDEKHAVSIDGCGQPTKRETGIARACCRALHDFTYGLTETMAGCPAAN